MSTASQALWRDRAIKGETGSYRELWGPPPQRAHCKQAERTVLTRVSVLRALGKRACLSAQLGSLSDAAILAVTASATHKNSSIREWDRDCRPDSSWRLCPQPVSRPLADRWSPGH